jgi:Tfp pilus assembly protein PilF
MGAFLFKLGAVYERLNLLDDAVQAYQHALKLEPTSGIGWTSLGSTLAKLKRFADAKEAARQAVKQSPDYGPAWALLGKLYSEESRYPDAADAFQKAAQLMPKDAEFWRSLAESYSKMNEPAKSQEAIQKSQDITGNAPIARASSVGAPEKDKYTEFITTTLRETEQGDINNLMSRYADKVVYRSYGIVDKAFIRKDLERYFKRWPVTKAQLNGAVQVLDTKKADEKRVLFSYEFQATSPNRGFTSIGSTSNEWWVWETHCALKVFGESQKITRGQKNGSGEFAETAASPAPPSPPSVQTDRDNRPVYVVVAPARRGLHIRSEPNSKSAIVATLHQGDRVFVNEGRVRNNRPPSPVVWQKVMSMNGDTGWINGSYIAPKR